MTKPILTLLALIFIAVGLNGCSTPHMSNPGQAYVDSGPPPNLQGFPNDPTFWQGNTTTIWGKLQHVSLTQLQAATTQTTDPTIIGWLNLSIINKQYSTNLTQLTNQLIAWRTAYPNHPGNSLFPDNGTLTQLQTSAPKRIALLLPLQGTLGASGQAVRDGFMAAYYESPNRSQQTLSFYDTSQNPNVAALYQQAIAEGADSIVGPLTKENVQELLRQGSFAAPTLALNYTDQWSLPTNFYEFGLSPQDEGQQVADRAAQAGLSRALLIAPADEWGQRVSKIVTAHWQAKGGKISDTLFFNSQTNFTDAIAGLLRVNPQQDSKQMKKENNKTILERQRRQDFDVIFLLAQPQAARQIVPLLRYYYADNIPIYATSSVYSGSPSRQDTDLNGVIFCDTPWTLSAAGGANKNRLYAVGRDAYTVSNQLIRFSKLPNFPIYGATGALTMTPQQQIYRRLAWTKMQDGHP